MTPWGGRCSRRTSQCLLLSHLRMLDRARVRKVRPTSFYIPYSFLGPCLTDFFAQTMYLLTNTTDTSGSKVGLSRSGPLATSASLIQASVMRACEGCRRRKIKCDAATTNTWPCSACTRLKLHCVPPTVNQDRDFANGQDEYDAGPDYLSTSEGGVDSVPPRVTIQQPHENPARYHPMDPNMQYSNNLASYPPVSYSHPLQDPHHMYQTAPPTNISPSASSYHSQHALFPSPPGQQQPQLSVSVPYPGEDETAAENISEAFGELNIGVDGVGKSSITSCHRTYLKTSSTVHQATEEEYI